MYIRMYVCTFKHLMYMYITYIYYFSELCACVSNITMGISLVIVLQGDVLEDQSLGGECNDC